jgi:CRP-like cAMP-binding protein
MRPDEFICKEGEASDRIYILAKGRAEVRTEWSLCTNGVESLAYAQMPSHHGA